MSAIRHILNRLLLANLASIIITGLFILYLLLCLNSVHIGSTEDYLRGVATKSDLQEIKYIVRGQTQMLTNSVHALQVTSIVGIIALALELCVAFMCRAGLRRLAMETTASSITKQKN
jgi:hypothetical protein